MIDALARLWHDERGASMTEYGILAAGLVVPILIYLTLISTTCGTTLNTTGTSLQTLGETP